MAVSINPAGIALGCMAVFGVGAYFVGRRAAADEAAAWRRKHDAAAADLELAARRMCGRSVPQKAHPGRSERVQIADRRGRR